jgi:hypothetical protein
VAIPTVIRLLPYGQVVGSPAEGNSGGGTLIEIYGGNFRTRIPVPFVEPLPPTVEVRFGTVAASSVAVVRSNLIRVRTPASSLAYNPNRASDGSHIGYQGLIDVTVTNLDDTGTPIPGETVTVADAWDYILPRVGDPDNPNVSVLVADAFVETWKRAVISNVMTHQSVFYQATPRDIEARDIGRPELPAIVLTGPRTAQDRFYEPASDPVLTAEQLLNDPQEAGLFGVERFPSTESYAWDVIGLADDRYSLLNLRDVSADFVRSHPRIDVPRSLDFSSGLISYDLDWEDLATTFSVDTVPSDSDLHSFRGSVILRGVRVENAGLPGDGLIDAVPEAETIEVDYCEGTPGQEPLQ